MTRLSLKKLSALQVSRHQIPLHGLIPNTSIQNLPLLIYHSCIPTSASASSVEAHLNEVGVVVPQWRYTMYSTTHFHSTTHELLCILSGRAKLCMLRFPSCCRSASSNIYKASGRGKSIQGRSFSE